MGRVKDEKEKVIEAKRRIYAICEGLTEKQYLQYFQENNRSVGRFDIEIYEKESFDKNQSNRMRMVDMLTGVKILKIEGEYTPYMYLTQYMHRCMDGELNSIEYDKTKLYDELNKIRERVMKKSDCFINEKGYVSKYDVADELVREEISENYYLREYLNKFSIDYPDIRNPEPSIGFEIDRYYVVFDRDKEATDYSLRSDEEYRRVLNRCSELGYRVLLSTPLFEFWLLLHHKNVLPGSYPADLSQKMTILEDLEESENQCNDWKNTRLDKVKSISKKRFELYYNTNNFKKAVTRSKELESDPYKLLDEIGSNVGLELESLMK